MFPWWQSALVKLFNLVLAWGAVPSLWKHSIIVTIFEQGDPSSPGNFRPVSLASCCFKVLEHLIHARIAPFINRQLSESQGGFRWGADALVGSLVNLLTMRASTHAFVAFVDIEKAFDTSWWKRWSDCTTLESEDSCGTCCPISSATQCRKFDWAMSCQISGWTRALLKGGSCPHSFSISWWMALQQRSSLLLQESICLGTFGSQISCTLMIWCLWLTHHRTLQTALNAVHRWRCRFRFKFGIGPTKSAVMVFGPRRRLPDFDLYLGGVSLPVVSSYKYLGVLLTPTLSWTKHVQLLISRGNRLFAQCVAWCRSEHLPVQMASSIFRVYVLPSVSWGVRIFRTITSSSAPIGWCNSQMGSSRSGLASRLTLCCCTMRTWMA